MAKPTTAKENTRERNKVSKMLKKIDNYAMMYQAYQNGDLTQEQWDNYCLGCLEELMNDNKEILKRLKNA
jgi:hypothetical protein